MLNIQQYNFFFTSNKIHSPLDLKYNKNLLLITDELQKILVPSPKEKDINLRRSDSSANTTSHSAISSSVQTVVRH